MKKGINTELRQATLLVKKMLHSLEGVTVDVPVNDTFCRCRISFLPSNASGRPKVETGNAPLYKTVGEDEDMYVRLYDIYDRKCEKQADISYQLLEKIVQTASEIFSPIREKILKA